MTVYIVTGLGYGDESKGSTVDFLSRQGSSLVVRHNGGPQAGHNVVTPNGKHHEFSQFGSGTFAGAQTYLSKHMLINPMNMVLEAVHLRSLGVNDLWERMYIDEEARIITPFHVALQRLQSYARGESCGKGIGECMRQDIVRPDLTIRVKDIPEDSSHNSRLANKLDDLRRWLRAEVMRMSTTAWGARTEEVLLNDRSLAAEQADQYHAWRKRVTVVDGDWLWVAMDEREHIIFEGAQGVLLDEWHGFHPYTTWSTTTPANALQLLAEAEYDGPVLKLGVTRAYATRHGVGPFVTQDKALHFDEPHNTNAGYQGAFRQGHLDLVALRYAVECCGGIDGLVVTHLDRAENWHACSSYSSYDFRADAMNVVTDRDLARSARRTELLMHARPVYPGFNGFSTQALLLILSNIAPIEIQSYGPTATHKVWIRKKAEV